jgi:regulator of protease activity HflC (stomatin/prohibitin superfamily)
VVVNKGEDIGLTFQLVKSDGQSVEEDATVSYQIFDSSITVEYVSGSATFNITSQSYIATIVPSVSWIGQEVGSYVIVWSVSDTDDDFAPTYTDDLQISIDKTKIDKILGLVHQNMLIDQTVYDDWGNLENARLRIYSDSASVGTSSNILATYQITSESTECGQFTTWKQVEA